MLQSKEERSLVPPNSQRHCLYHRLILSPCSFVKRHLLKFCLELASDRVVGIRMAVAALIPSFMVCCIGKSDHAILDHLQAVQASLQSDSNPYVRSAAEGQAAPVKVRFLKPV